MLPLLVLTMPPVAIGSGYVLWTSGRRLVLVDEPPSTPSYVAGIATLGGSYAVMSHLLFPSIVEKSSSKTTTTNAPADSSRPRTAGSTSFRHKATKNIVPPHLNKDRFVPPQSAKEVFNRIGRPAILRMGTGALCCFLAGLAQGGWTLLPVVECYTRSNCNVQN